MFDRTCHVRLSTSHAQKMRAACWAALVNSPLAAVVLVLSLAMAVRTGAHRFEDASAQRDGSVSARHTPTSEVVRSDSVKIVSAARSHVGPSAEKITALGSRLSTDLIECSEAPRALEFVLDLPATNRRRLKGPIDARGPPERTA